MFPINPSFKYIKLPKEYIVDLHNQSLQIKKNIQDILNTRELHQAKLCYHQIGPSDFESENLEGLYRHEAVQEMIDQLTNFLGCGIDITSTQREKINESIKILNDALDRYISKDNSDWPKNMEEAVLKLEREKSLLILGGYLDERGGHAVTYEIKREQNNTFTFTIINTGEGCEFHNKKNRRVRTLCYTNLTEQDLNEDFFNNLNKKSKNIKNIYEYINDKLFKKNNKISGKSMKMQRKGVCAWKSISTWVHSRIVPNKNFQDQLVYDKFKLFILKKKRVELKNIELQKNITKKVTIYKDKGRFQKWILSKFNKWFGCHFKISIIIDPKKNVQFLIQKLDAKIQKLEKKIAKA